MKVAVVGTCQTRGIAESISILCPDVEVTRIRITPKIIRESNGSPIDWDIYDHVFVTKNSDPLWGMFSYDICRNNPKVTVVPHIAFNGFHPDSIFIKGKTSAIHSAIGPYNSSIVANSYVDGLTEKECYSLFVPKFYKLLSYGDNFDAQIIALKQMLNSLGFDGETYVTRWVSSGTPFMLTMNHPRLTVMEDLSKGLLNIAKIPYKSDIKVSDFIPESLLDGYIYPVYGVGNNSASYNFKSKNDVDTRNGLKSLKILSLSSFISESYRLYKEQNLTSDNINKYRRRQFKKAINILEIENNFKHPYKQLPDTSFWSRSIARVAVDTVNPVVDFSVKVNREDKVATAGSCFAQHIAKALSSSGMNYFVAESGPEHLNESDRETKGYGLFSARYGNIYTPRQLVQLFDRAYGYFQPEESYWIYKDGGYIDPYRPNIGEVFKSIEELRNDTALHLKQVRYLFENLDIFVFTLGLTESWVNVTDGAIFPVGPGIISDNIDKNQYRFKNFSHDEVVADLHLFIRKLREVNNSARLILTVSPVPLVATAESKHVLTSTTYSKSVLRSAADNIAQEYNFVDYFPSFEIITGSYNKGAYFASDLRSVTDKGVKHVMGVFMSNCTTQVCNRELSKPLEKLLSTEEVDELEGVSQIVCDEELIEK